MPRLSLGSNTKSKEATNNLWWFVALEGFAAAIFGLVVLFAPAMTLMMVAYAFAVLVVVWGLLEFVRGVNTAGRSTTWWAPLVFGVLSVGLGVYLLRHTGTDAKHFVTLAGAWVLLRAVYDLYLAGYVHQMAESRVLWGISGALGVVATVWLWSMKSMTSMDYVWVLGLYALLVGALTVAYTMRVRDAE